MLHTSITPRGLLIRLPRPVEAADWLCRKMGFHIEQQQPGSVTVRQGNCCIVLENQSQPVPLQEADEGHYTGLAHIAFATGNIQHTVESCQAAGIPLAGGETISYNPGIWGTGMNYINPRWDYAVQLEISQRIDLPAYDHPESLISGLEHVGLPVADMAAAIEFYRLLGFQQMTATTINRADGALIFCTMMSLGELTIELFEFANRQHKPYTGQPFAALLFTTDDISRLQEDCRLAGIPCEPVGDLQIVLTGVNGERLIVSQGRGVNSDAL